MRFIFSYGLIFWLLGAAGTTQLKAQDFQVQMYLERGSSYDINDYIDLSVEVEGSGDDGEVDIAGLEHFEIEGRGVSRQMSIINGVSSSKRIYQYSLVPKKAGRFQIGPAVFKSDGGQSYQSQKVTLSIGQSGQAPGAGNAAGTTGTNDAGDVADGLDVDQPEQRDFFARLKVDQTTPFVNEQVLLTFELYARVNLKIEKIDPPSFGGFWFQELENAQKTYRKNINGQIYTVNELYFILVPSSAGPFKIEPFVLTGLVPQGGGARRRGSLFSFFNTGNYKRQRFQTNGVNLEVQPLPPVPANMQFSGLVGRFEMDSKISKNNVAVGESLTWELTIRGVGNVRDADLKPPPLDNFKVYEDRPQFQTQIVEKKQVGVKTFKWALVPQRQGIQSLPPLKVVFFDTEAKQYRALRNQEHRLQVAPGQAGAEKLEIVSAGQGKQVVKRDIEVLAKDLMPLKKPQQLLEHIPLSAKAKFWLRFFNIAVPLSFFGWLLLGAVRPFFVMDPRRRRKTQAFKEFKKQLSRTQDSVDILKGVKVYVGQRLNLNIGEDALTKKELLEHLNKNHINGALIKGLEQVIDQCELAQYGGGSTAFSPEEWKKLKKQTLDLVQGIDKKLKV